VLDYRKLFEEIRERYLATVDVIMDLETDMARLQVKLKKREDEIICLKAKLRGVNDGVNANESSS